MGVGGMQQSPFLNSQGVGMQPPKEDRYAALKDLDSLMKTQQASSEPQLNEWSTGNISWHSIILLLSENKPYNLNSTYNFCALKNLQY